jgi:putative transposase
MGNPADNVGATRRVAPTNQYGGSARSSAKSNPSPPNALRGTPAAPVPGRNDDEHIIRYETSLNRIRRYIAANPSRWAEDRDHPCHPLRRRAT